VSDRHLRAIDGAAPADDEGMFTAGPSGRPKFVPRRLAESLRAETPIAAGGEQLYVYARGAYRPDGEDRLQLRIARTLGDQWKRSHAEEVLAYLRATSPPLWERPPLDRLNVANGILDLDTGKLQEHDPEFRSPIQVAAAYDPKARCPAIDRFVGEVVAEEVRAVVVELVGYLLTPDNSLQVALMLLGEGANGKSTMIRLLVALLGEHNVSAVALHRLDEDRFATAELYGKLANVFADLDSRALRSSSIFKAITGGDAITAERKFRDTFTFIPYARLVFSANEPPPTPDSSDAFFRRWLILPFERNFAGHEDRQVLGRLTTPAELSGLLNLGLEALPQLRDRGRFTATAATTKAAAKFKVDSDSVAGFLDERCEVLLDARIAKPALFRAYRSWCEDNNRQPLSAQRFNRRIRALIDQAQRDEVTVSGTEYWTGLTLRGES
jgi:putative DNA primase/helicase